MMQNQNQILTAVWYRLLFTTTSKCWQLSEMPISLGNNALSLTLNLNCIFSKSLPGLMLSPITNLKTSDVCGTLKSPVKIIGTWFNVSSRAIRSNSAKSTCICASRMSCRFGLNSKCVVDTTKLMSGLDFNANFAIIATLHRFKI